MFESKDSRTKVVIGFYALLIIGFIDYVTVSTGSYTLLQTLLANLSIFGIVGLIVLTGIWIDRGSYDR